MIAIGSDQIRARDGNPELVNCGIGADTAQVDASDTVDRHVRDRRPREVSFFCPRASMREPVRARAWGARSSLFSYAQLAAHGAGRGAGDLDRIRLL